LQSLGQEEKALINLQAQEYDQLRILYSFNEEGKKKGQSAVDLEQDELY